MPGESLHVNIAERILMLNCSIRMENDHELFFFLAVRFAAQDNPKRINKPVSLGTISTLFPWSCLHEAFHLR